MVIESPSSSHPMNQQAHYGFLKITDRSTGISIVDNSSSESLEDLLCKISALNLFSCLMKFEVAPTHVVPEGKIHSNLFASGIIPTKDNFTLEQKRWAAACCKEASLKLYHQKAVQEHIDPPYPIFSALYKAWAEINLDPKERQHSIRFREKVKSLINGSLEGVVEEIADFLKTTTIDPITIKSACISLAGRFPDSSAEIIEVKIYQSLNTAPTMTIFSPLYRAWVEITCTDPKDKDTSIRLIAETEKIIAEKNQETIFDQIATLFISQEIHPIILEALSLELAKVLNSFSQEEIKVNIQAKVSKQFEELIKEYDLLDES